MYDFVFYKQEWLHLPSCSNCYRHFHLLSYRPEIPNLGDRDARVM